MWRINVNIIAHLLTAQATLRCTKCSVPIVMLFYNGQSTLLCHVTHECNLSASSRISTSTSLRWNDGALRRWSISRPGVAMTMSGNWRSAASWDFMSSPPGAARQSHSSTESVRNISAYLQLCLYWDTLSLTNRPNMFKQCKSLHMHNHIRLVHQHRPNKGKR